MARVSNGVRRAAPSPCLAPHGLYPSQTSGSRWMERRALPKGKVALEGRERRPAERDGALLEDELWAWLMTPAIGR